MLNSSLTFALGGPESPWKSVHLPRLGSAVDTLYLLSIHPRLFHEGQYVLVWLGC